ncbi:hypothetical protein IWW36_002957 [Coemansia brasiliensis]|uniref:Zinc finger C2H2 LYAR-type domain-containing protein n=1 Tax=Coemansia brasiliensis TaxID=2650707 RepID=A0A9W8IDR4_9FUNG|nr:hypothetical protein IWW36_002957 [Coemansia brasiliensis]
MVSFVCNYCQETIKKPKLDAHTKRCHNASFSCIDCGVDFVGTTYRQHTSCMTEAEKYEGKLHKKSKANAPKPENTPKSTVDQLTAKAKQLADQQPPANAEPSGSSKRKLEDSKAIAAKKSKWYKMDISEHPAEAVASAIVYCVQHDPADSLKDMKKNCIKMVTKHHKNKHPKSDIKSAFDKALLSALSDGKVVLAMPSSTS